jgi:predicted dehydrogenase
MINVGVIGLGFMGQTHIKAYRQIPGTRIAAICDAVRLPVDGNLSGITGNISATDQIRFDMTQVKAYWNYEELLANPDIDLVDICVPTPQHPAIATAALRAGKHVVCEKPLARTAALCREIVEAAATAKGFFMPAMCLRFWPEWVWLKEAIQRQLYGRVLAAHFRRFSEPPGWSQNTYLKGDDSGGALLDLHIHDTDFVQFCFGRPRAVFSTGISKLSGAIDHLTTLYQVAGGAVVSAEGSWLLSSGYGFKMAYTVILDEATVDYDSVRGPDALRLCEKGKGAGTLHLEGADGYVGELRHMIEAIQSGQAPTVVTAQDGLAAVEICEAEEQSVKTGQVVSLS